MKRYWVIGGEYKNTEFMLAIDTLQCIGPFETYEEARDHCNALNWKHVDQCHYRYEVADSVMS